MVIGGSLGVREVVEKFRDGNLIRRVAEAISKLATELGEVKIMHVCGSHEHTITYYGLRSLLPENVELIAGPGCPVCVVPAHDIDSVVKLARDGIRVFTFGDMYRVPGSRPDVSLAKARAEGCDVVVVYSFLDAVKRARDGRESVFFGIGFETTQPSFASLIRRGKVPKNLTILCSFRLTVPAVEYVLGIKELVLKGVIAPGHVSTIVGARAWEFIPEKYGIPCVVSGFEPLDVMVSVLNILSMLRRGEAKLVNEYSRVVKYEGNTLAKKLIEEVFDVVDAAWRGIGFLPSSGLELKGKYSMYNARVQYGIEPLTPEKYVKDTLPGCRCADVILGLAKPTDCPLFMKVCTPQTPYGPCMVSSEGTCAIWAKYGGYVKEVRRLARS